MRLFGISGEGSFAEYVKTGFKDGHREETLEAWLEQNPNGVVADSKLLIVGRQVRTSLGGYVDLLGLDRSGHLVVLELKRGRTPRETVAQALEYVAYAAHLDYEQIETMARQYEDDDRLNLAEFHRDYFSLGNDAGVSFNKDQRIVIVAEDISPEIHHTADFLNARGLRVTCLEFSFFCTEDGKQLLSGDTVVSDIPAVNRTVVSGSSTKVTREQFMQSLDENGSAFFGRVLRFADERGLPIHWGTKGFSINVNPDGAHFKFAYGYPPQAVYGQSFLTRIADKTFLARVNSGDRVSSELAAAAERIGVLSSTGNEFKCSICRPLTEEETTSVLSWIQTAADRIEAVGLRGTSNLDSNGAEDQGSSQGMETSA